MKKLSFAIGLCVALGISAVALAQLPTFKSSAATGSTSAAIIFPQGPSSQIRVVSTILSSDLSTSILSLYSGTTAHYVTVANTNLGTSTSLIVESTNGMSTGSLLYLQGVNSNVVVTISSFSSPTNIVTSANIGCAQAVGSEVEVLSSPILLGCGAVSNKVYASDGLFVGNYGRCVYATLNGTSACTNYITVHYDGQSQ